MPLFGDGVQFRQEITDYDGVTYIDPDTHSIKVYNESGAQVGIEYTNPTREALGKFNQNYSIPSSGVEGIWVCIWASSKSSLKKTSETFFVVLTSYRYINDVKQRIDIAEYDHTHDTEVYRAYKWAEDRVTKLLADCQQTLQDEGQRPRVLTNAIADFAAYFWFRSKRTESATLFLNDAEGGIKVYIDSLESGILET